MAGCARFLRHYGVFSGQDFRPASRYDDVLMAKLGHVHLDMPQGRFSLLAVAGFSPVPAFFCVLQHHLHGFGHAAGARFRVAIVKDTKQMVTAM